jgi:hypothetical protein
LNLTQHQKNQLREWTYSRMRQAETKPLMEDFKLWLDARLGEVSQKSGLAEAIRYALSHWEGLTRFLSDGRIEIDSNTVERTMRPIALEASRCHATPPNGGHTIGTPTPSSLRTPCLLLATAAPRAASRMGCEQCGKRIDLRSTPDTSSNRLLMRSARGWASPCTQK